MINPTNKLKIAVQQKQYNLNNKAKNAAKQKQYRLDNKAKIDAHRKRYILTNKLKISAYGKQYRLDNKAKLEAYFKQYRVDSKAKIDARRKRYRVNNKAKITAYRKRYRLDNTDILNVKSNQYNKQRCKTDPVYKMQRKLRNLVYGAFKRIGQNKPARTEQLLGCSWLEAKAHFERLFQEGMSWENHGEWHIDHIRPVASFKADELHLMNHISNLQPLWAEENLGSKKVSDMVKWGV